MRTLNRPMFRYGGPIKEGVMNGIREPKRNGGSMGEPQMLNTVGSPYAPSVGGRSNYAFNPLKIKDKVISTGVKTGVRKYLPQLEGIGGRTIDRLKNFYNSSLTKIPKTRTNSPQGPRPDGTPMFKTQTKIPGMERAGMFARNNPKTTIGGAAIAGQYAGDVLGGAANLAEKGILQVGDLLVRDKYFDQDKYMKEKYPDGFLNSIFSGKDKESDLDKSILTNEQKKIRDLQALLDQKNKIDDVPTKSADELRQDRIQKYRDIMDIKGMNKNAAYNSLIAASQAISGEGDFKGSIKDGSLINKIIQSTSKAFDKPNATKDAIDTLILKGEIEGDIAAGKPSSYLKTAQDMVATGASKNIQEAMKKLTKSENSMSATLGALLAKNTRLDEKTVGVAYRNETGNIPAGTTKLSVVNEWKEENKGKNEIDYVKELIKQGADLKAGDYIIGERVVTINESGKPEENFFY